MEKRTGPLVEFVLKGRGIEQDLHAENRRFICQTAITPGNSGLS